MLVGFAVAKFKLGISELLACGWVAERQVSGRELVVGMGIFTA